MPQRLPQTKASPKTKKCFTWWCILLAVILAAVTGVLIWQFAPIDDAKDKVLPYFNGTNDDEEGGPPDSSPTSPTPSPPPPTEESSGFEFTKCKDTDSNCCNGIEDGCDLRLNEPLFAMAHNAMSTIEDGYPTLLFPNHEFSLEKALEAGYRGLSLDVCNCGGTLQLCHAFCNTGTRDPKEVFTSIVSFLEANPTETVLLNLQINNDFDGQVGLSDLYSIMQSVKSFTNMTYVHDSAATPDWPTLGTLVEDNKRIVMFHLNSDNRCNNNNNPCPPGLHYWFQFASETPFSFFTEGDLLDTAESCRLDRGGRSTEFFAINNFISPPVKNTAKQINTKDFIEKRISACSALNGGLEPNVVYVDYWSYGDLLEVTHNRNKALVQRKRRKMLRRKS